MPNTDCELIAELKVALISQRYSPVVAGNYCAYARVFLDYLALRRIPINEVTEAQVAHYLHHAIAMFRKRHGRSPGPYWHSIPRSGIHALLRLAQGQWPPAPKATCAADALRFAICDEYETWLREERGLAEPSIYALMWEGRNFLAWQLDRCGVDSLMEMAVGDIDRYMETRTPHQTRKSVKDVAERLRSILRYLHRTGRTAIDLSPHVIAPLLYAYGKRRRKVALTRPVRLCGVSAAPIFSRALPALPRSVGYRAGRWDHGRRRGYRALLHDIHAGGRRTLRVFRRNPMGRHSPLAAACLLH